MNTDTETTADLSPVAAPSADFVRAVSDFLDTDPTDLLDELGYYERQPRGGSASSPSAPAPDATVAANG
jgi:hypothetical protein